MLFRSVAFKEHSLALRKAPFSSTSRLRSLFEVSIKEIRLARSLIGLPAPYSLDRARGKVKSSTS